MYVRDIRVPTDRYLPGASPTGFGKSRPTFTPLSHLPFLMCAWSPYRDFVKKRTLHLAKFQQWNTVHVPAPIDFAVLFYAHVYLELKFDGAEKLVLLIDGVGVYVYESPARFDDNLSPWGCRVIE